MKRRHVPLAWYNLTHDLLRFALFGAGICFAVVLMFVEYGFRNALLDSNVLLLARLDADLILVSRRHATLATPEFFPRGRLTRASGVAGVRSVHPLYLDFALLRDPRPFIEARSPSRSIRVLGVDPEAHLLDFPELNPAPGAAGARVAELKKPGRALYDRLSKPDPNRRWVSVFGPLAPGVETDLAGQRIRLAGSFDLGSDFGAEGTLLVSTDTFADCFREQTDLTNPLDRVECGLVRLKPGADPAAIQRDLRAALSEGDVVVCTRDELMDQEKQFWLANTPIGFVFGFGMVMGFVVGTVICYQILAGDVVDHLPEYATLRAIGYPGHYLGRVVLQEALILATTGFFPALLLSWLAYRILGWLTGLPLWLTPGRVAFVFGLTVAMCVLSGWVAVRKARGADPAEVF